MAAPILNGGRAFFGRGIRMKNLVEYNRTVTLVADDVATTIFTINVPNPATGSFVSAYINVSMLHVIGAGGTIGAGEGVAAVTSAIVITRTPGLAAVISIASLINSVAASVAGGDTAATPTLTNVAVAGANTAAQTFAIQTIVDDDTNVAASNHTVVVFVQCQNAGVGVTFSA
jgi:hypothetical protein